MSEKLKKFPLDIGTLTQRAHNLSVVNSTLQTLLTTDHQISNARARGKVVEQVR